MGIGAAVTLAGTGWGLKTLESERIPQVAVLSAVFFVASLVHFPVGPSSVHLIMNGLIGVVLGPAAFPAILVALLLQAVMFGFGGLIVLGVNVMNMAVPALFCRYLVLAAARSGRPRPIVFAACTSGALAVLLTALMVALCLAASGKAFIPAAKLVVFAHLPVMAIEAAVSAAIAALLLKVKPELLGLAGDVS